MLTNPIKPKATVASNSTNNQDKSTQQSILQSFGVLNAADSADEASSSSSSTIINHLKKPFTDKSIALTECEDCKRGRKTFGIKDLLCLNCAEKSREYKEQIESFRRWKEDLSKNSSIDYEQSIGE